MAYQHILIAIDFSEQSKQVCEKAKQMAADNQASLSICHIIEDFPITDFAYEPMLNFDLDLRQSLLESGEKQLEKIAESVSIPKERQYLELGVPDNDIVRIADEQKVDLIIIGSHGR
ncbi:MAG TPA: universal stress protein, partial [Methylophaga aminisulfidivorans]|nr:universal stress protein [Methylophaga aminisulfidivorans]